VVADFEDSLYQKSFTFIYGKYGDDCIITKTICANNINQIVYIIFRTHKDIQKRQPNYGLPF